jgi:small-conductance mechanosensitive channel
MSIISRQTLLLSLGIGLQTACATTQPLPLPVSTVQQMSHSRDTATRQPAVPAAATVPAPCFTSVARSLPDFTSARAVKQRGTLLRNVSAPLVAFVVPKRVTQQHAHTHRTSPVHTTKTAGTMLGMLLLLGYVAGAVLFTVLCLILWPIVPALGILAGLGVVAAVAGIVRTTLELLH